MATRQALRMSRLVVVVLAAIALVACGGRATPTPQPAATPEPTPEPSPELKPAAEEPEGSEVTLYIGPRLVECEGEGPMMCMQVKENLEDEYGLFYSHIEGFGYEEGYEYALRVRVDPVADPPAGGSSLSYTLVEILDKRPVAEQTLFVGPYKAECVGVGPMMCMLVKERPEDEYGLFYDQIAGFDYEGGYEYELLVRVDTIDDPPADASSLQYSLLELVQKKPSLEGRTWVLAAYADADGQESQVIPGTEITAELRDGQVSGSAGCNNYFGAYQISGSQLTISDQLGLTMMFCETPEGVTEQENAYLAALQQATTFEVTDKEAVLADAGGNPILRFVMPGQSLEGTTWMLESYVDDEGQVAAVLPDTTVTAEFQDGQIAGSAGCNNYFGTYELSGNQLAIGENLGLTAMLCGAPDGIMEQEQGFLAALAKTASYRVTEGQLELVDAEGMTVTRFVAMGPDIEGRTWVLEAYVDAEGEEAAVLPGTEITVEFEDGEVSGSAGCNNYFGSYRAGGGQLAIGEQLGVTMMMCADDVNAQEQAYLIALQQASSYRVTDGQLELVDAEGRTTLTFVEKGPGLEGRLWQLEAYADGNGPEVQAIPGTEVTIEFEDGRLGGSAGCNNYFGTYEADGNQLAISGPLGSTMMMCGAPEGVMEQEQAYLAALQQASSFEATDTQLLISDSSGHVILRYKVLEPTSLTATTWLVTGYNNGRGGFSSLLRDTEVTAVFVDDGSLVGSAGCNQYTASYQIDGDDITIGPVGLTRKMCSEPEGIMEQEQAYLAALESAATLSIKGDRLELRDAEGTRMVAYVAIDSSG